MRKHSFSIFRIILGIYLACIGGTLFYEMMMEQPSDMVYKSAMGAAFFVIGAGYAIWNLKKGIDAYKSEKTGKADEETERDREEV